MNILIAEDHSLTARLLESMLSSNKNINVVGVVSDGKSAIEMAAKQDVDVCLMDISMPQLDGINACEQLKKANPKTKVVILSGHTEKWVIEKSLEGGASGYLTKHADTKEVVKAVKMVFKGKNYFDKISSSVLNPEFEVKK